jgi:TonB family protein
MKKTKLMTLLLAMLACMTVSAQDTMIDETCPPQFPGGDAALINFLNANVKYPSKAAQDKVEGKVIVQFTVKKTGKIDDVKVLRSVRKDLDDEAVRVIKMMPDFIPAKQNGEVADMPYTVPVSFKLFDDMEPLTVSEDSDVPDNFQPPMFPGGERALMEFLRENVKYPPMAAKRKTQGRVVMTFVVDKTGKVTEIKVAQSVDIYLDTEAIRVCKLLPDFIPARQNGEPVSVWFTLPITFRL